MDKKFLLVSGQQPDCWAKTLALAVAPLGFLETTTQERSLSKLDQSEYILVVIDSTAVAEPVRLTSDLLAHHRNIRVVVATASPTWKRALEVIRAGAMDYIPKNMIKEELQQKIERILQIPLVDRD
jgi:DNA-binding NtrC family response regulator